MLRLVIMLISTKRTYEFETVRFTDVGLNTPQIGFGIFGFESHLDQLDT